MANATATEAFRNTFNKVRRELSKASHFGFGFNISKGRMKDIVREAMIDNYVPCTSERIALVDNWVNRACRLGGGAV